MGRLGHGAVAGAVLFVWARVVSPVSLNTLHIGLMLPAMESPSSAGWTNVAGETTTVKRG